MAGDWIKFETTTPDKPEIFAIAEQLQLDPDAVVGKLMRVWIWADSQTEDGHIPVTAASRGQRDICHASVTHKIVDRLVSMPGFAAAMEAVCWLSPDGSIPGFGRHNGETAKKRALARERKARQRTDSVTHESRKQRDKNVTREEKSKRREEGKTEDKARARATALDLSPLPIDLDPKTLDDFRRMRERMRAPLTDTAVSRLAAELERCRVAGFSPNEALGLAVENGWRSVKLGWLQNRSRKPKSESTIDHNRQALADYLGGPH